MKHLDYFHMIYHGPTMASMFDVQQLGTNLYELEVGSRSAMFLKHWALDLAQLYQRYLGPTLLRAYWWDLILGPNVLEGKD